LPATLLQPRFKATVRENSYGNAIFAHLKAGGVCGYEQKGKNFTGFAKHGEKGLWYSANIMHANRVVIVESAIDALSHAQLFETDEQTAYVSVGGGMSPKQEKLAEIVMKQAQERGATVTIATDNDPAGRALDKKLTKIAQKAKVKKLNRDKPEENHDWNDALKLQAEMTVESAKRIRAILEERPGAIAASPNSSSGSSKSENCAPIPDLAPTLKM